MNADDVVAQWLEMHSRRSAEAEATHDSQSVAFGALADYDSLNDQQRKAILPVLAKWLEASEECLRYDAAFIISQRSLREMAPEVKKAIERCERAAGPESAYEAQKLRRILENISTAE